MSQEEISPLTEHPVKTFNDCLLCCLIEIDDHIAAEDDIHFTQKSKPVLVEKVEMADGDKRPDLVIYLQTSVLFMKKRVI